MEKRVHFSIWYFVLAALAVVWLRDLWIGMPPVRETRETGEQTAMWIDESVRAIVNDAFLRAVEMPTKRRAVLESGAARLGRGSLRADPVVDAGIRPFARHRCYPSAAAGILTPRDDTVEDAG